MADMYTQTALVGGARWVGLEGLEFGTRKRRGARQQRRGFGERDGWWFRCAYRETARPVSDRSRLDAGEWGWVWFEAKSGTGWQDQGPTCSGVRLWGQSVPRSGPRRRPGRCSCRRSRPRLGEHSRRGDAGPGVAGTGEFKDTRLRSLVVKASLGREGMARSTDEAMGDG